LQSLLSTNEGRLAASLIRDFLEILNLDFTLSVYDPELNPNVFLDHRDTLIRNLKMNNAISDNKTTPVLVNLVKQFTNNSNTSNMTSNTFPNTLVDNLKIKYDKLDINRTGNVERSKIKNLFQELFPNFSKNIIDSYLLEELDHNENYVTFKETLNVYKKWYMSCITSISTAPGSNGRVSNLTLRDDKSMLTTSFSDINKQALVDNDENELERILKPAVTNRNTINNEDAKNNKSNQSKLGDLPPLNQTKSKFKKEDENNIDYNDDFSSSTITPRTPRFDRKVTKNRNAISANSDEEIEDNLSFVEESKVS
jgi:hypothetical protein